MFNNRMLAVAAVLVMAVPALGAATPIVVPPVPEQLVEGHTVFTVIEIVAVTATNETRFAAAVAVLVREYQARNAAQRFPGVLWFNDQYLTNPEQSANAWAAFRYPCGGAVMAVNAGDPDPRVVVAEVTARSTRVEADHPLPSPVPRGVNLPGASATAGDDTQPYNNPPWVKPHPGTYTYENDYAWIGADVGPSTINATNPSANVPYTVWSDTVVGTIDSSLGLDAFPWDYRESYLITDPNDHSWIIDVYDFYTRYGASGNVVPSSVTLGQEVFGPDANALEANRDPYYTGGPGYPNSPSNPRTYTWPVWVVNMLGSPVFVPDYGITVTRSGSDYVGESCLPFKDLIHRTAAPVLNAVPCGGDVAIPNKPLPPYTDDPCMGYMEPSRNGFCYGGQQDIHDNPSCPHGTPGNDREHYKYGNPNEPLRLYNALLYFKLQDLRVWDGTIKDHCNYDPTLPMPDGTTGGCNPALSPDTNGCSSEQYPWGPNPPQAAYDWPCPGHDDNAEGNSHPFHPLAPPHTEAQPCLPQFSTASASGQDAYRRNPTNHGGSSYIYPDSRDRNGWYQTYAPCDYAHTTRNIDIYFSPAGRPFPPPVRWFDIIDLEGSAAPFQDFHSAYPGVS